MSYQVVEAQSFWDSVHAMRQDDNRHKAALVDTIGELRRQPFQNSKLSTHQVGEAGNGKKIYASDVAGRKSNRRVVWQLFSQTIVLFLYGSHRIYDRIKRMRVEFDPEEQAYIIVEREPVSGVDKRYHQHRDKAGKLFMAWTDNELRSFGLPDRMISNLRLLDSDDDLLNLDRELGDKYFERCYNLVAHGHPDGEEAAVSMIAEVEEDPTPPETTEEDREVERHLQEDNMAPWFTRTEPEYLAEIMDHPIEDWMIFLHPDQRKVVRRRLSGPARVRGAAGTGKTVVGLHRAVWLAKRNQRLRLEREDQLFGERDSIKPVLFTSYIRSLSPVLESLYLRMPGARAGEVDFRNVDNLALRFCRRNREDIQIDLRAVNEAYDTAYKQTVAKDSPLGNKRFSKQYLRDEVTHVIKGRALESPEEYLAVARTGRKAPLGRLQRAQVWRLREAWDAEMEQRGVVDFPDIILKALHHARRLEEPPYSAVIIDEAQDLTLAGLQFLRALVNAPHPDRDRPEGLLILGDGAQRIYPGGYTLRQAGVEVRGRTTVLAVNYRNTTPIVNAAVAVAGGCDIDDLEETYRREEQLAEVARQGPRPRLVRARDPDDQINRIAEIIRQMASWDNPIEPGDTAVLAPWNREVNTAAKLLRTRSLKVQKLDKYDGRPNRMVKVGTYDRAKGLEFKAVFLPYLNLGMFPRKAKKWISADENEELRNLDLSRLFVAMTRARDVLVLLHNGEPSEALLPALERLDVQDSRP